MSRSVPKPRVVELFGLPGSGKSHVAGVLAANEDIERIPQMVSRADMLRGITQFPWCALRWLGFLVVETVQSGEWALMRYRLSLVAHMFGRYARARASGHALVLLDEGFLQRILSVSARRLSPRRVSSLMRGLWPDSVLMVEVQEPQFHRYGPEHIRSQASRDGAWKVVMRGNYEAVKAVVRDAGVHHAVVGGETDSATLITRLRAMITV